MLNSDRLQVALRPVADRDLSLLMAHRNDPETRKWLEDQTPLTHEMQTAWFLSKSVENFRIIEMNNEPVGLARISVASDQSICSVGLDIFKSYRGQGLGKTAFGLIVSEALKKCKRLELWVFAANIAAVKIYEHHGFVVDTSTPVKIFPRALQGKLDFFQYMKMVHQIV